MYSFANLNQSVVPCLVLTCFLACIQISQETDKVVWYSSLRIFHSLCDSTPSKPWHSQWSRLDVFLEFFCFLYGPTNVVSLISGSFAFAKPTCTSGSFWFTYCWSLTWRVLSITWLTWNERNCMVVWTFFEIAFLWDWNDWINASGNVCKCKIPFLILWPLLSFWNFLAYWVQHFHSIIF